MAEQDNKRDEKTKDGSMTTQEAGHLGGQRVRELIEEGKEKEAEQRQTGKGQEFGERAGRESDSNKDAQK